MTTTIPAAQRKPPKRILVNGHRIRWRSSQSLAWTAVIAVCGGALVAGAYFDLLEVNWHVHIGHVAFQLFWLKHWWDSGMGIVHSPAWVDYRHGYRDFGEPAVATMAVKSVMAKRHWWGVRASRWRLLTAPIVLLTFAAVLITGAVWVKYDLLPNPDTMHSSVAALPHLLSVAETLGFGFLIGRVLHRFWAPVGATIQGYFTGRAADHARDKGLAAPRWVQWPAAPPVVRERIVWTMTSGQEIRDYAAVPRWARWLIGLAAVVAFYLIVTGLVAHFWIGTGHSFPYLAP